MAHKWSNVTYTVTTYWDCSAHGFGSKFIFFNDQNGGECLALLNVSCSVSYNLLGDWIKNLGFISAPQYAGYSNDNPTVVNHKFFYANSTGAPYLNVTYNVNVDGTPLSLNITTPDSGIILSDIKYVNYVQYTPSTFHLNIPDTSKCKQQKKFP